MTMKNIIISILTILLISCNSNISEDKSEYESRGDIKIFDEKANQFVTSEFKIELLADSLYLAEGPLWVEKLNSLLFTQAASNKIFSWNENDGLSIYMDSSGYTGIVPAEPDGILGSNGMTLDSNGNLILTQHGDRRISKLINWGTRNSSFETIIDNYDGKLFNSPNDLVYSTNGDLYFTDPPYGFGLEKLLTSSLKEQPVNGVYKLAKNGDLSLLIDDITLPNGIAISPDNKTLYVNNSDVDNPFITKFDITESGLENREIFFDGTELTKTNEGWFDGIKVHSSGTVFSTGPGGVFIIDSDGNHLATIGTTSIALNCAFGKDEKSLYITAFDYLARVAIK